MSGIPIIVTLAMDADTTAFFNILRKKHFPPAINYLDAHLTLFHHLPDTRETAERIAQEASEVNLYSFEVKQLKKLGRGVAYAIHSPETTVIHRRIQQAFMTILTPQDRQPLQPHVTIQNKVDPAVGNALYEDLSGDFKPFRGEALALVMWEYHGGPWTKRAEFPFRK